MIGLPSDDTRQSFVNQLQMALFAYIKKHPAGDRPLLGLFVMDEAQTLAPSGTMTACTQSTLALASQARKYGLELVFATQAPEGLHNRIPGNAATQFYGLLNSPRTVAGLGVRRTSCDLSTFFDDAAQAITSTDHRPASPPSRAQVLRLTAENSNSR